MELITHFSYQLSSGPVDCSHLILHQFSELCHLIRVYTHRYNFKKLCPDSGKSQEMKELQVFMNRNQINGAGRSTAKSDHASFKI